MSACPVKPEFDLPNQGILLSATSLMPETKLGPSNLQLGKENGKKGGVDKSLPHRNLEKHRNQPNKPAIGQQQALPKAKPKQKKGQRKVADKLSTWEKNDYFEKLQLVLLDQQDPRASLDHNTGRHLSLRIMAILSLMNKWELQTLRIPAAHPKELTKTLRKLELTESKVDSEIMIGHKLVVVQHEDCLLISGDKMQQECFCNKLSAHHHPTEQQQLGENAPLNFWDMLLEQNQADKAINMHPTKAFYQDLLGRYSLEDARGGETPIELDRTAPRWTSTNLDAERSKLYKETVGKLAWLSMLRPEIAFAVHRCSLSFAKPTEQHEDQLRSLLKYIAGTQTYTINLQIPRRWERAKNLELLAFSTSWVQSSRAATCASLSFMGVHLGASIQQATSKSQAELLSVRLASILAFHTKSLLQDLQLAKPLCFRVLTRGPVPSKLGLSKRTRHIELSSHLGQFRLSKVRPQQNLAELLANNLRACELHRLLPKLQLQARCTGELALPTVRCEGRAFFSSGVDSFYIGQLRCAPAMEKPQLVQKLSGKESVDHLAIPKLDSTDLIQHQLSSGGAITALHIALDLPELELHKSSLQLDKLELRQLSSQPESSLTDDKLERSDSTMSLQQRSLQKQSLQAAYSIDSFQSDSLTELSLSFQNQLTACLGHELEKKAVHTELLGSRCFQLPSSTRAFEDQLAAWNGSTRALEKKHLASPSALCASRKQFEASNPRIFPNLVRELVILLVISLILCSLSLSSCMSTLILHSLSFLSYSSSLTCISLSFPFCMFIGWARELSEQNELLTTFVLNNLDDNELQRTEGEKELVETLAIDNLLWDHELEELLTTKSFQLDQPQQQQQDQLEKQLWSNQHQQNLFENELDTNKKKKNKNDKKLENKEFDKKNFQSLIYKKLVALLQNTHFASAASSQLLGYEAWGKYREASADSFDRVGDKELLQQELRQQLGFKDLRPAYSWALCPESFEDTSFTAETFANTSFDKKSFAKKTLDKKSFEKKSFHKQSFHKKSFAKTSFAKQTSEKKSLDKKSFATRSSTKNSFDEKSFAKKSFPRKSFGKRSLDKKSFEKKSFHKKGFAKTSFVKPTFGKRSLDKNSFAKKSFDKRSLNQKRFEKESFDKKRFSKSSLRESSLGTSSLETSSLAQSSFANSSLAESSLKNTSFQESSFKKPSFKQSPPTAELEQLAWRTSTSELAKLEQRAFRPELDQLDTLEQEELRTREQLKRGSFSLFLGGSSSERSCCRGGVLRGKLPLLPQTLDKLEPLQPLWLKPSLSVSLRKVCFLPSLAG